MAFNFDSIFKEINDIEDDKYPCSMCGKYVYVDPYFTVEYESDEKINELLNTDHVLMYPFAYEICPNKWLIFCKKSCSLLYTLNKTQ